MRRLDPFGPARTMRSLLLLTPCVLLLPSFARSQAGNGDEASVRGNRPEIVVTVHDGAGGPPVSVAGTVRLSRNGAPSGQAPLSKGQAFFLLTETGDYTVVVDAAGYKTARQDVEVDLANRFEVDVYMRRDTDPGVTVIAPGGPLLAPKAKESLDKALQDLGSGKIDQAQKHLSQAMKLAPNHPDVLYVQGVVHLRLHNWTEAESVLEKATQLDPKHARAYSALGMAFCNEGKYDAAVEPLEKSVQLNPAIGWETQWTLGRVYYRREKFDEALKISQQALTESKGKEPEIELLVAQALTAVGRYEDSAQTLRDFIKNHGDHPKAATARRWLDRLAADGKIKKS